MRYEISHTFEFYQQIGAARILMVAEVDCRAIIQPDMRDERGWSVNSIEVEADDDWHVVPEADELFRQIMARVDRAEHDIEARFCGWLAPRERRVFERHLEAV